MILKELGYKEPRKAHVLTVLTPWALAQGQIVELMGPKSLWHNGRHFQGIKV